MTTSFTDLSLASLVARATGIQKNPEHVAVVEAATGKLARAFAAALVEPNNEISNALTSSVMYQIGKSLLSSGESVWLIDVDVDTAEPDEAPRVKLIQATSWDVFGDARHWSYRIDIAGPNSTKTIRVPAESVVHPRINVDPAIPYKGQSPLSVARSTAMLAGGMEAILASEAAAGSGNLIPAPIEGMEKPALDELKADVGQLDGRPSLVPTMAGGWGEGRAQSVSDWKQVRIGFSPPEGLVKLRPQVEDSILSALATPPDLIRGGTQAQANREAWRQYLHGTVEPLAKVCATEFREKLHPDITLSFDALKASDVQGRARAFQSLVAGGMDVQKAAILSGLLEQEETPS